MKFKFYSLIALLFVVNTVFSQQPPSTPESIEKALEYKSQMLKNSLVKHLLFTNIGPSIMSGRVTDVDANPKDPTEFYVAYASGGVWHTKNNGMSFSPIMDNTNTQNVGDIAIDWNTKTIWVGTGENNASRSSYSGIGILKSQDNGKTWKNVGLKDAHHIGRILINPNNPDEVVVGVTGHLYSPNSERGIYKTTDGGNTWSQTLFVDDKSGIIDLQYAPDNFNIMYASSWTKDRKAWNFDGSGENSAIYKSTNAGNTWIKISTKESGFPIGKGVGRIGLAVFDEHTIYASHDNQYRRPNNSKSNKTSRSNLNKEDFKSMSVEDFLRLDNKALNNFLKTNGFHEKYRAENVKQLIKIGTVKPNDIAHYLEDANALLFDTPVIGAEVYKSTDGGRTWKKTHRGYIDDLYYSYGYYFGEIRVDPQDVNNIYILGVPLLKSNDGGKTFFAIDKENVHVDHQALWINPNRQGHLINGNDGGLNITYDDGAHWIKNNFPNVGQFYTINIDYQTPYNVYGGLQDNGVWTGPHNAKQDRTWLQEGQYPWKRLMGGDGMQVQIDKRNPNIVYTGYQFGNYFRINRETQEKTYIQPKHKLGESPYRFNWQTPIILSHHNQDILYLGSNKLMRSMNQGNDWTAISKDLTNGGKKGNVAYGTLTSISESSFQFGLIYTGSDDGLVYVTKNSGDTWENISGNFPKDLWVSRVVASQHKKERVYVALNGYRWDDFNVYLYKSDDYGKTWINIANNIPDSPVNVIKEDPKNPDILYVGTDNGAYISFDQGNHWEAFSNGLPAVAVHDIAIQPQAKHLLLGTHGRSIYKADIAALQDMTKSKFENNLILFEINPIRYSKHWGNSFGWYNTYEPTTAFVLYSKYNKKYTISIESDKGLKLHSIDLNADAGFNYVNYDLSISEKAKNILMKEKPSLKIEKAKNGKYYLPKGTYNVKINNLIKPLKIE